MVTCSKCKLNYDERRGACPRCKAPLPEGVVVPPRKPPIKRSETPSRPANTQNKTVNIQNNPSNIVDHTAKTVDKTTKNIKRVKQPVEITPENAKLTSGLKSRMLGVVVLLVIILGLIFGCMSVKGKLFSLLGKDQSEITTDTELSEEPYNPLMEEPVDDSFNDTLVEEENPEIDNLLSDNVTEEVPQGVVEPTENTIPPTEPSESLDTVGEDGKKNPVGSLKNPHPIGNTEPYGGTDITVTNAIVKEFKGSVVLPPSTTATKFGVIYIKVVNNLDKPITNKEVGIRFADQDTGLWLSDDYILKYKGEDSELVQYKTHGSWEIKGGEEGEIAVPFDPSILKATDVVAITLDGITVYYKVSVQE